MILTKNSITDIILTGSISNSELAETFIRHVKEIYKITIAACYCDTSKTILFPEKLKKTDKISSGDLRWVNNMSLHIFTKNHVSTDDCLKKSLLNAFEYCVRSSGSVIDYSRVYTPEEIKYYGWNKKRFSEWDFSKIVIPCGTPIERKTVDVESFDDYVIWHCMSYSLERLNKLKSISSIYGKVYCGWDNNIKSMNLFIVVPENNLKKLDKTLKQEITDDCFSVVSSKDKFDIIGHIKFQPHFTTWSCLPDELRFAFSRDGMKPYQ
jgi:hypothetical protein